MEKKRHVLSSESSERIFGKHSGFRNLRAYQVAELCYDFTCRFCELYIPKEDRHHDQMVQAHYLVERLMARQAEDFEKGGGFSERLYKSED